MKHVLNFTIFVGRDKQTPNHVSLLEGRIAVSLNIVVINALYLAILPYKNDKTITVKCEAHVHHFALACTNPLKEVNDAKLYPR